MSQLARYATLIDGAFLIRKLESRHRAFPTAAYIESVAAAIGRNENVAALSRLRVYFYHARPAADVLTNPISKKTLALGATQVHANHARLLKELEMRPDFALRLGETSTVGWKIGSGAFRELLLKPRLLEAEDLVPAVEQKGVDLRIGLDISRLALTRAVEAVVVVTGDSDLIPAFKFARREGLRVYLCHLGHGVKRELKAHADRTIRVELSAAMTKAPEVEEAA